MDMRDICLKWTQGRDHHMNVPTSQEARAGKHRSLAGSNEQSRASMMDDCPRCGKTINGPTRLVHVKAEEYLIGLIKRDHPEWVDPDGTCPQCATYYRVLVERTGV